MTEEIISRGHPRAYVQGVLSFDLEALDRWYGVKAPIGADEIKSTPLALGAGVS